MKRPYCTIAEIIDDLKLTGLPSGETAMMRHVRAASRWIEEKTGSFYPVTAAKTFRGKGASELWIPPLLSVSSIAVDGDALTSSEYELRPLAKHWEDGPYTCVSLAVDEPALAVFDLDSVVVITGTWGLYDATEALGQTLPAQMLAADVSFAGSDGSKFSPGMMLRIESEQILITATGAFTDSTTNTSGALDESQETIPLVDGTKVAVGEVIRIEFEQMKVLDVQTNTAYVKRGWNQTTIVSHLTNQDVYVLRTFAIDRGCNGTTAALHAQTTAISRQLVPEDVNYLAREIAALMQKKSESSFAGRIGNAESGETAYFNEFPKDPIDKILSQYGIFKP